MAVMEGTLSAPLGQTVGQPSGGEARRRAEAATSVLSGNGCRLADLTSVFSLPFPLVEQQREGGGEKRHSVGSREGRRRVVLSSSQGSSPAGDLL